MEEGLGSEFSKVSKGIYIPKSEGLRHQKGDSLHIYDSYVNILLKKIEAIFSSSELTNT
jgi:hypothetical protein